MKFENLKVNMSDLQSLDVSNNEAQLLFKMFESDNEEDLEKMVLEMSGLAISTGGEKAFGLIDKHDLFKKVRCEVYKFICTDDEKYAEAREFVTEKLKEIIQIVAAAVAAFLGVLVGLITGIVSALIMLLLKLGKKAWCNKNSDACNL